MGVGGLHLGAGGSIAVSARYLGVWGHTTTVNWSNVCGDFDVAYPDGGTTQYMIRHNVFFHRSTNGGASFTHMFTGNGTFDQGRGHKYYINIATHNKDDVIWVRQPGGGTSCAVYRSTNGGVNHTLVQSGIAGGSAGRDNGGVNYLGRWPYNAEVCFYCAYNYIGFSIDGMVSLQNKNGNWTTAMGAAFAAPRSLVPLWIEVL